MTTVHDFELNELGGQPRSLKDYEGKVLLIVNTASECAFTPQYEQLKELRNEFKDQGFEVLAFPSDSFNQEYKDEQKIAEVCNLKFNVDFPVFEKIKVKGSDKHPLFEYLSNKQMNGKVGMSPKWNFQKYLVDREGRVKDYFFPFTKPTAGRVKKKIKKLL
ncbi:MAG: glutathione peroxidase [Bacteroidota bacterium]